MIRPAKHLVLVLSSLTLLACGGGGGGGGGDGAGVTEGAAGLAPSAATVATPSLASLVLAKYEGVWQQPCVNHMRRTTTLVATSVNVFTVTPQENLFANADCTGALVATGSFGKAQETVQYRATLPDASVKLPDGTMIQASVDPATSTLSIAPFTFSGSGVRSTVYIEGGKTLTTIAYASGDVVLARDAVNGGTTEGGLVLRNGELLALVPVAGATASFAVNQRFFR